MFLKQLLVGAILFLLMPYLAASAYGFVKAIADAGKPKRRIYYMRPPSPDPGLENRLYNRLVNRLVLEIRQQAGREAVV